MKKSDISNISNAESVERAEDSGQMNAQPSGQVSERFSKKAIGYLVQILWGSTNLREAL